MRFHPLHLLPFLTLSLAQSRPPAGSVQVTSPSVDTSGMSSLAATDRTQGGTGNNGCPPGTFSVAISADNSIMTLMFDNFEATIGPKVPKGSNSKYCAVTVKLDVPDNWRYRIDAADYRGYCNLESGVTGTITSGYGHGGKNDQTRFSKSLRGPLSEDYLLHSGNQRGATSPCGKQANSKNSVRITLRIGLQSRNEQAQGLITADSADHVFKQELPLTWEKC